MKIFTSDILSIIFLFYGLYTLYKGQIAISLIVGKRGNETITVGNPLHSKEICIEGLKARLISILMIVVSFICFIVLDAGESYQIL